MRIFCFSIISFILINVIPSFSFAVTNDKEFDMDVYAEFAGYGFLVMLLLFFIIFLYYSTHHVEEPHEVFTNRPIIRTGLITGTISAEMNIIYYSVIVLIILSIVSFVLLIT
jgi:hypothetical protein